jgi:hypothetical protein
MEDKASFADTLRKLSKLTWRDISTSHRHGLGYEQIPRHCIHASIPSHVTADVQLIAFRFSGKKAMVGYRDNALFRILWLDRDFTVYNHG